LNKENIKVKMIKIKKVKKQNKKNKKNKVKKSLQTFVFVFVFYVVRQGSSIL